MAKGGARYLLATSLFALAPAAEAGETILYGYDSLGRLVRVERSGTASPAASATYSYDAADNRARVTVSVAGGSPQQQSAANGPLDPSSLDSAAPMACAPPSDELATSDDDRDGACSETAAPPPPPADADPE